MTNLKKETMAENKKEIEITEGQIIDIMEKHRISELYGYLPKGFLINRVRDIIKETYEQALLTQKQEDKLNQEKREHTHQVSMQCAREASFELGKEKAKQEFENIINECSVPVMDEETMNKFIEQNSESSVYRIVNFDKLKQKLGEKNGR